MELPIFHVDAFAEAPFEGNPAAVCLLPSPARPEWMQAVAAEMNLSETAFVVRGSGGFDLRWFTPTAEVDLCGHATLAAAHVLWHDGWLRPGEAARFLTRSGVLQARPAGTRIVLDFPAAPADSVPLDPAYSRAIGKPVLEALRSKRDLMLVIEDESAVRALEPDLEAIGGLDVRGVIVTARADGDDVDFVSRFFAPRVGIDEDPVTGSAHCTLGPYWGGRLGKTELVGRQVSPRGGTVRVRLEGDRALLAGKAVTVLAGKLLANGRM